ncbi:MAG: PEP-utilizing enzyme [Cellvibrionales bacterium]|nr:PEP-utilizing enzyme [Cellvibrionales bacterium]
MDAKDLVIEISGQGEQSTLELGGKAQSLHKMIQAGFPVPPAFCVTVPAYKAFLAEAKIDEALNQGNSSAIQTAIQNADIPEAIKAGITAAYEKIGQDSTVAIRSSAIGEDAENKSFAGQYDTFLHVEGQEAVLNKVKACWSSLFADRVQGYDEKNKIEEEQAIAVVIQQMIDADCAGVLFTQNPITGNKNQLIIEGCYGLGEGVVSGQVVTDSFTVNKRDLSISDFSINEKSKYCTRDNNGEICLIETPHEQKKLPCLSDNQIKQLAEQAKKLAIYYGKELDIEWAFKDGKLWLLQARPITTTLESAEPSVIYANPWDNNPAHKEGAMFSRMDTGEIVTGLMTPLGLSFCDFYQRNIHGPAIKTMGLKSIGNSDNYMGYIQGHVYLNISGSAHMLRQCPPTRDEMKFTTRYATEELDFTHYKNPYGEGVKGWDYAKSAWFWLKSQVHNLRTAEKTVQSMTQLRQSETERFLALDLPNMTLQQLNLELSRIDKHFLDACAAYMPFFLQSFALYDALTEACDEHLKGQGEGLQNRIKSSMNNLRTIEVTKGIVDLVDEVKQNANLKALFENHTADELLDILPNAPESEHFYHKGFKQFLFNFGSRGRQEFELSIPRWSDDPTYLFNVIKSYLENDIDLDKVLQETASKRETDSEQLLQNLPFGPRKKIQLLIKLYSKMSERREETRPTFITETWFYRKIIVEVLSRLEKNGILNASDLPYIDFNRFRDYVAGNMPAQDAFSPQLLEKNRRQHLFNQHAEEPPMALIGGFQPKAKSEESEITGNTLTGLAASPGQLVAKARVITNLQAQVSELQKGEILVAKFTDATWTPLFLLASGVVTDIGSTLSHSSIVAREFGIPAIVNLKHATTKIKTGDLLVLDGSSGTVTIKEDD